MNVMSCHKTCQTSHWESITFQLALIASERDCDFHEALGVGGTAKKIVAKRVPSRTSLQRSNLEGSTTLSKRSNKII